MERQLTYDVSFDKECESDDQFLVLSEAFLMIRLFHLVPGHLNRKDVILHLKLVMLPDFAGQR